MRKQDSIGGRNPQKLKGKFLITMYIINYPLREENEVKRGIQNGTPMHRTG